MPSTTNREYEVPTTGSLSGTWGSAALNPNFEKIDQNLGAVASVTVTTSNVVLSAGQYVCGTIRFSGALTGNRNVTFPSVAGWWTIENRCTGNFFIRMTCGAGNSVCPPPGEVTDVCTDGSAFYYRNLPHLIGGYWDYAGSSVPVWVSGCTVPPYLYCNGGTFSAATYPFLNTILGGNTLPDARGRSRFNINDGTGRITTAGSSIDGNTRFTDGGAQNVTLTTAQLAAHTHAQTAQTPTFRYTTGDAAIGGNTAVYTLGGGSGSTVTTTADASPGNTSSSGGGDSHTNMPPTYIGGITMIRAA
jgi:microcystin-dependent protein